MQHSMLQVCRVCRESLAWAFSVHYECPEPKNAKNLMTVFGIDLLKDDQSVQSENFCHKCPNIIYNSIKKAEEGRQYTPRLVKCDGWESHTDDDEWSVCNHTASVQRGGASKKCGDSA